jgi:arylsulfatase A-like enzyme
MSQNVVRDYGERPTARDPLPPGWDTLEDPARYLTDDIPRFEDFYGFQHAEFAIGHGNTVTGHHYRWALEKGADPALLVMEPSPDDPALARYPGWWQVFQPALPEEYYSTSFVTERTLDWLSDHGQAGPWCLECSYPDPHHPFTPPGRWWDRYRPEDMPEPVTFDDPLTDAPRHLRKIQTWEPRGDYVNMFGPSRELVRHAMAAEFGMIEMLDEGIGRVLDKLDELGQRDNTIVVFTSDHGDMFGDHGLMLKGTMHYQGCLRVPFVIRAPGRNSGRTDSLASSLDIPSTILDLTGVAPFADMQGVSLAPLLDDPTQRVREAALVEEDMPLARLGGPLPLKTRTVLDERYRYTRYSTGEVELYDLDNDPGEMTNLAVSGRAGAAAGAMAEKLADALMRHSAMARMGEL